MKRTMILLTSLFVLTLPAYAAELHVATDGNDSNPGAADAPLRTIQRGAELAQPGDTITVHAGAYRERVNPPRGGTSDAERIVYQAAPGATVEIKGSELITGWEKERDDVWKVTLPNTFFGSFNPYADSIKGDWFAPLGRTHHTGAVYLNGDWLTEAAALDELFLPAGQKPAWLVGPTQQYLLNIAWLKAGPRDNVTAKIPAADFAEQEGIQTAECSEGGQCIGFIEHGDWVSYRAVDMGTRTELIEFRAAAAAAGGLIEIRLDKPDGDLLGTCEITSTGGWQNWRSFTARIKPVGGQTNLCLTFRPHNLDKEMLEARNLNPQLWFAQVDATHTTIWAQFSGVNPNEQQVEINVRQSVFYPDQPGRNYITVRGFTMRHAATPWAPPTAQQIGLLGTHWSKGWLIEDNIISHSVCTGITLGKHGDEFDNTSADTAEGYVKTIERAQAFPIPWTKENLGHHIVRNNRVSHCEQAGIVGSLGAAFSTLEGNVIHDIHLRRLFSGAEMAGIKIHAAIDATIRGNHIYRSCRGLWLDWMAQGTRVSANLFHDNPDQDLFVEVNHGPFLVDNNIFLSTSSLLDMSEGGAYVHNLFGGSIVNRPEPGRETPYHPAHSTTVAGLAVTTGGDNRFFNNLFVGHGRVPSAEDMKNLEEIRWITSYGPWGYDGRKFPLMTGGNVYYHGAQPSSSEASPVVQPSHDPEIRLVRQNDHIYLHLKLTPALAAAETPVVTTELLGEARVPELPYTNPDVSPITIDTDYFGNPRRSPHPAAGPFAAPGEGAVELQLR